jgi:hypothetical protein
MTFDRPSSDSNAGQHSGHISRTPDLESATALNRVGPVAGILGWILVFVGLYIHGYPDVGASGQELVEWTTTTDVTRFAVGIYIEDLGILLELVFFAWLSDRLRRHNADGWLAALVFGGFLLYAGFGIVINAVWTATLHAGARGLEPLALAGMRDIAQEAYYVIARFLAVSILAACWAAVRSRALPRWLAWSALPIGIGLAVPSATIAQGFEAVLVLWVLAVAVVVLFPRRAAKSVAPRGRTAR